MKKTIFLVGKLYDLSKTTANEIEADVQSRLDYLNVRLFF